MALSMTLTKDKNRLYVDFIDAYWVIDDLFYTTDTIHFSLKCYPNRESKEMNNHVLDNPSVDFGCGSRVVDSLIYSWNVNMDLRNIFSNGVIPAGKDAQYPAIYKWVKKHTGLPFRDVFES